jgi:hypothetical protein
MTMVKIVIYDDNPTVEKIDMILSKSGTKHMIKHGESEGSLFDVIVFDKVDAIVEHIRNKFKHLELEFIEQNIDSCDVADYPLPQLIPDNPDVSDYTVHKIVGSLVFVATVIGFFLI